MGGLESYDPGMSSGAGSVSTGVFSLTRDSIGQGQTTGSRGTEIWDNPRHPARYPYACTKKDGDTERDSRQIIGKTTRIKNVRER